MSFDIPQLHIPDNSPEAQAVEQVMNSHHVGPKEAVLRILRDSVEKRNPAQRMIGLFSSEEDGTVMDSVMDLVEQSRKVQTSREIGL